MNCLNHPERERVAFCQNCGKPLCQECLRSVGTAIYCEPCLAAKLAGVAAAAGPATYVDPAAAAYAASAARPVFSSGPPNPVLAGLLGFIPGVGAMYNEQYFKGVVHLIVFAILVSLVDNHGIFGLFIAGWEFYMAIEAYHTARARRDGEPLPNPFGLNDLGERLGFGKAWSGGATPAAAAMPVDPYASGYVPTAATQPVGAVPPYAPPFGAGVPVAGASQTDWAVPPTPPWQQYVPPMPPIPQVPLDDQVPYPGNRFPAGAIWLIGLGTLFLVFNAGFLHGFSSRLFVPVLLIGLAVFVFVKKMTSFGGGLASDGSAGYRLRVVRALRGSVWLALVGLLFFLDDFRILSWGHSWPLFIIVAGLMTVLQRGAYGAAAVPGYDAAGYTPVGYAAPGYGAPYDYPPQPPVTGPVNPVDMNPAGTTDAAGASAGQPSSEIAPASTPGPTNDEKAS